MSLNTSSLTFPSSYWAAGGESEDIACSLAGSCWELGAAPPVLPSHQQRWGTAPWAGPRSQRHWERSTVSCGRRTPFFVTLNSHIVVLSCCFLESAFLSLDFVLLLANSCGNH